MDCGNRKNLDCAEKLFLIGGTSCLLIFLFPGLYLAAAPQSGAIYTFLYALNREAIFLSFVFSVINFRCWRMFIEMHADTAPPTLPRQRIRFQTKRLAAIIALKSAAVALLIYILLYGGRNSVLSFLLMFSCYLMSGALLSIFAAALHKHFRGEIVEKG